MPKIKKNNTAEHEPKDTLGKTHLSPEPEPEQTPPDDITLEPDTAALLNKLQGDKKTETRGRSKSQKTIEAEELQKGKDFFRFIVPQLITSLEKPFLNSITSEEIKNNLAISTTEKNLFTESFLVVAEKRGWLKFEEFPELALVAVSFGILYPRIVTYIEYRRSKTSAIIPSSNVN